MVVTRTWTPLENIQISTGIYLDIWDSGDKKVERWPDGTEFYWRIIDLEVLENGQVKEVLEPLELWDTPARYAWTEKIPLLNGIFTNYEIPGWRIIQESAINQKISPTGRKQKLNQKLNQMLYFLQMILKYSQ